ncbi:carbohydrate ABC transporter permease [Lachnotalea sp. AF33-28]|uniref:carbohydrate ABC transporter permease n=1 Tax=Lachnotalea sp. AF33-28 TaxID=2292046 RepID=UPI001FAA5F10|nr:carbohydrate ABC transporter permease [Lachnotalea sp. AF33-28]
MAVKTVSSRKKKMSGNDIVYHIVAIAVFSLIALMCVYPFYYLLICTISDNQAVDLGQVLVWPKGFHIKNYLEIFKVQNLGNAAVISVVRTVTGTAASMLVSSYMAYFFTKEEMWGRKFWYRLVVITMYFSAGMIPVYLNNKMLGLLNSFWIYIIPGLLSVYNMILIKTSIEAMPPDLEESAYLDGAGYFTRFFKLVLPLQKPILATVALFSAVGHWNDFFTTKLYITKPRLYTLQFLLYELLNQITAAAEQITNDDPFAKITPTGIRLTLTAVVVIPIMLVYPFVQKYYVKGIMVGAVKG